MTAPPNPRLPQNYAEAFLMCRDLMHAWVEDETTRKRNGAGTVGSITRVLSCTRCNTTRIDSYNYRGEMLTRLYRQPKGYKLPFRLLPSQARARRFKRTTR